LLLKVLRGPALSGKTERLAAEIMVAHQEDPLSYTFLGPSAEQAANFGERFARRVNGPVPSGNFLSLDKMAGDLHRFAHPDETYLSRGVMGLLVAESLYEMTDEELGVFAPLRGSAAFAQNAAEAVWELSMRGEAEMADHLGSDEALALAAGVKMRIDGVRERGLFDLSDAYRNFEPEVVRGYVRERYGTRLFADGIADLHGAEMIFLSRLLPLFEEGVLTLDPTLWDPSGLEEFLGLLEEAGVEVDYLDCRPENEPLSTGLDSFLRDGPPSPGSDLGGLVSVVSHPDPETETLAICRETKKLIVEEGLKPGDISIVVGDPDTSGRELLRALSHAGVPARLEEEESLLESKLVQLLLLPFRAATSGYPPELILALIDHGIGGNLLASSRDLERIATSAGLLLLSPQSNLNAARRNWRERLDEHLSALQDKRLLLSADETVLDMEIDAVDREVELCMELLSRSEELFGALEGLEYAKRRGGLEEWSNEFRRWIDLLETRLSSLSGMEDERFALRRFLEVLLRMVLVMEGLGRRDLSLDRFLSFLQTPLSAEARRSVSSKSDVVEILSPALSQYRYRRVKFVAGFSDGLFPKRAANPLYQLNEFSPEGESRSQNYYQRRGWEERSRLRRGICTSNRAVVSYPRASREGEPLVPTLWLYRMAGLKHQAEEEKVKDEVEPIPTAPPTPMSRRELKVEYGLFLARGGRLVVPVELLPEVEPLGRWMDESRFSWRIDDFEVCRSLMGKNFSYSKLRDFKSCPFKFFLKRAMGIEEPVQECLDLSPLERGLAYHGVLKSLYDGAQKDGRSPSEFAMVDFVEDEVERMVARFVADQKIRAREAVRKSMVRSISSEILGYLDFEASDPIKACIGARVITELPFSIELGRMKKVLPLSGEKYSDLVFRGRIDRIDIEVPQKKGHLDLVVSDYKSSGSSAEWEQLWLYSLVLLALESPEIPALPESMRAFFRTIRKPGISKVLEVHPREGRMVQQRSRPKCEPGFSDVDLELREVLDSIFDGREFKRADQLEEAKGSCYLCPFKAGPCSMTGEGGSN
jgi:ATP-dependent helicase/nuclease subunit B